MLAQVVPGLREIRGPLASGFLWLLLGWLVLHEDVASTHGKVREVVELGEKLNPAALAAAASFVAYLVGSLSEDGFGMLLTRAVRAASEDSAAIRLDSSSLSRLEEMSESLREAQMVEFGNRADRLEAESELRIALVPPAIALVMYFALTDDPLWWLGLLLVCALAAQAWLRTRDYIYTSGSLFMLRQASGIPPASALEAASRDPSA